MSQENFKFFLTTDLVLTLIKDVVSGDRTKWVSHTVGTRITVDLQDVDTKKVRNALREWLNVPERRQQDDKI